LIVLLLMFVTVAGCADRMKQCQEAVDSWMGMNIDDVSRFLGPPTREKRLEDGQTVRSWEKTKSRSSQGTEGTSTETLIVVASPRGTITSISYPGCQ